MTGLSIRKRTSYFPLVTNWYICPAIFFYMKIKSIHLQGYKRFADKRVDFFDPDTGAVRNLTVLVGKNGSGKSTILQAIASMLGTAVGKIKKPSLLNWPGYDYKQLSRPAGNSVTLSVQFDEDELIATHEFHATLNERVAVGQDREVSLSLNYFQDRIYLSRPEHFQQFKGRYYAIRLRELNPDTWNNFDRVGTIMWYTEQRTSTSVSGENGEATKGMNEEMLRRRLTDIYNFHFHRMRNQVALRNGQRDVHELLAGYYATIFREKTLLGPNVSRRLELDQPPYYYLNDTRTGDYEISGMSGGERALFPILLDFANWKINKSVILIDELELHLHPPLQQAFLSGLTTLGNDNQFIITTHSDYVASLVPESAIVRLD